MGLILPQTVKIRIGKRTCKYYREKGYEFEKCGDFIEVDVLDLQRRSHEMVKVVCDICGKEREIQYRTVVKCNEENELITCGNNSCKHKKYEDTCTKKYGTNNPSKVQEIKDKKKKTCQIHFGVDSPFGSKEIQNKSKKTWQEKYGKNIANPFQVESVKNKIKATNLERYGCEYSLQSEEVKKKSKKTWQEKYGKNITNPLQVESIKNRMKATCKERYGTENPMQNKEIQDRMKATCKERYGVERPLQSEKIKKKMKETMMKNYGVEHALQNRKLLNKALDSFCFNSTGPCSKTQKYIHFLIGGAFNKRVCNSLVDICFEEEKIAIEYDGSGHFLGELMVNEDRSISKEALLKEKEREDKIVNNGYKMIRFVATKDRIPSDEVILNLIEEFKNSDFKVIRINFEEGTIEKDYNKKLHYDFGKLRRITKEDLEQFESKKQ